MEKKLRIGLTFSETRYENYPKWLLEDPRVELVELHWKNHNDDEIWEAVESCDGLVLSGGVDIHPQFYDNENLTFPNGDGNFNTERDEFEMHVFETALNFHLPVLAICRGLQLVNVALGGDLIQDLEAAGKKNHRRINNTDDRHAITIENESLLLAIAGSPTGEVNGAHHQATGLISEELTPTAWSADGVVEALEWKDKAGANWLLAVQWHPERMMDKDSNPLSKNIREAFLNEAMKHE
ncbi:MAG: gamma-glutamyl-gamma-aminobutyrate hydrolase family protein [Chitinophagales bacterium]